MITSSCPGVPRVVDAAGRQSLSVAGLVTDIARSTPDRIALRAGSARMSYGELSASANRLAAPLQALGVGREVPVGICLERSFDQIVAVLAALKTGAAFLPLDPAWPEQRLQTMLDDAQAPVLVGNGALADRLSRPGRRAIRLDRDAPAIARLDARDVVVPTDDEDLAYIIYTSGSTGAPKGVELTRGNLFNLVSWHRTAFAVTAEDRASHLAGLGFDAAVWEIWPYLTAGASVTLVDESVRTSPLLLWQWLADEKITIAFVPTPLAEPLITAPWPAETALRLLLTGGDTLHRFPRPGLPFAVVNNYGPAECAVVATSGIVPAEIAPTGSPTIGCPIANARIHLLDGQGDPVPEGATGEICIGGAGVGRGYRNRPDLTRERFVADRFDAEPGRRLYRTGDLGCRLPSGEIGFRGRIDSQVRVRGQRVEPDEIASALNRHPQVATSVVVTRGSAAADQRLVAYMVPAAASAPTAQELRDFLATLLPDFMIPTSFVRLESLPMTTNGKVDKSALPEPLPENALEQVGYRAPETPVERFLAKIIADVLAVERIGADDNFFLIGGHSLLGTQVVLRARETFGVDLTLRHLFEAQTVANLGAVIERLLRAKLEAMSEEEAQRWVAA
ncbi:MAG TPA: non-ribosomal peptide synthetase [Methylomirabilota bacterium]|nr:non-ribosomal peptide synthetase [Methylomirabilota bacterium]